MSYEYVSNRPVCHLFSTSCHRIGPKSANHQGAGSLSQDFRESGSWNKGSHHGR
jgi:hypothetical protein